MSIALTMTQPQLYNAIKGIAKKGAAYYALVHATAVQAMLWAQKHDDARPMDQLVKALGHGTRVKGFTLWVEMFSPIRWNGDDMVGIQPKKAKKYTPYDIEGANALPFWDATKENDTKSLKVDFLLKLMKRELAKIESADKDGNILDETGKVKFTLEGNVVAMKNYARAVDKAIGGIPVPVKVEAPVNDEAPVALERTGTNG